MCRVCPVDLTCLFPGLILLYLSRSRKMLYSNTMLEYILLLSGSSLYGLHATELEPKRTAYMKILFP